MIIVLNGPLGIGKSTLAEALTESVDQCVMLDGDHLIAANPPPADPIEYLHATIAREALFEGGSGDLGEPFDVSAPPMDLVATLVLRLGLR